MMVKEKEIKKRCKVEDDKEKERRKAMLSNARAAGRLSGSALLARHDLVKPSIVLLLFNIFLFPRLSKTWFSQTFCRRRRRRRVTLCNP
jgi:hypothetical protein